MIRTHGKGVVYGELWFDEEPEAPLPDILLCSQRTRPWPDAQSREFVTLLIDLTLDETALFDTFSKTNRYQIRRSERTDGGQSEFIAAPKDRVDDFCRFFDAFAAANGLKPAHRSWMAEAAATRRLVLTNAAYKGDIMVWHAYVVSGNRARMFHSASHFRTLDAKLRATAGRLNRWLHWRDMLEFKRSGFQVYDFGGIFSRDASPATLGINRFKSEFGGVQARSFNCTAALTWKGRIYLNLLALRGRFQLRKSEPPA